MNNNNKDENPRLRIYIASKEVYSDEVDNLIKLGNASFALGQINRMRRKERGNDIKRLENSFNNYINSKYENGFYFLREFQKECVEHFKRLNEREMKLIGEVLGEDFPFDQYIPDGRKKEIQSIIRGYGDVRIQNLTKIFDKIDFPYPTRKNKLQFFKGDYHLSDFSEWLDYSSNNSVSRIEYASSERSVEIVLAFIYYWGIDQYSFTKDALLWTYQYLKLFLAQERDDVNREEINIKEERLPEIPRDLKNTILKYDKVEIKMNRKEGIIEMKLER